MRRQVLPILDELVTRRGRRADVHQPRPQHGRRLLRRVLVMYAGRIVEDIPARDLKHAEHPYTRAMLDRPATSQPAGGHADSPEARSRLVDQPHHPEGIRMMPSQTLGKDRIS